MLTLFPSLKGRPAVIGMLHAPPLPGSPAGELPMPEIVSFILRDAESLAGGGVDGLLIENFGDAPFYPGAVPPATTAQLTRLAVEVRKRFSLPLGINVLRNDALAALSIAAAADAQFIRVNILSGARLTDQGIIQGPAHELLRLRKQLNAQPIRVLADVDVKHSASLAPRPLADETADLVHRAGADGLIVSGSGTGRKTSLDDLKAVKAAAAGRPVFVGSGISAANIGEYASQADGLIVGSSLKANGDVRQHVDPLRVKELLARLA
ncbi:MAG TPA: BtpA/SgcQ family protein [Pirellulaceae bacterium]|nr:BtpA/SgcQ family protein [Pirellulaceae bacterium]